MQPRDVSAVVCTMNSISGIRACLTSLRDAGVGQIVVVDANSTDGTREVSQELADLVRDTLNVLLKFEDDMTAVGPKVGELMHKARAAA